MNNLAFAAMSFIFKIRDLVRPPKDKLLEIGIEPGGRVLDYGCGPGSFSIAAAKLVGKAGAVNALDIHAKAIESVKKKALKEGMDNIRTIQADSPAELTSESFDVVILYDIFHDFADPAGMLRGLHRVMKPDAVLSFSDHHMKEQAIMESVTKDGLFELARKGNRTYSFKKSKAT